MAQQMLYSYADIDEIEPKGDIEMKILQLAIKHGFFSPMWDCSYGYNRPSFNEVTAFVAEVLMRADELRSR